MPRFTRGETGVGDELEQAAVRIAEVNAGSLTACAKPLYGPRLDRDRTLLQVPDRGLDRSRPDKAQIAVARLDGETRHVVGDVDARAVYVQLCLAQPVRDSAGS